MIADAAFLNARVMKQLVTDKGDDDAIDGNDEDADDAEDERQAVRRASRCQSRVLHRAPAL